MNNKDLKKLALMGIVSGMVVTSQSYVEAQNTTKTAPRTPSAEKNTQEDSSNSGKGNIAQSYSNQGYFYNQDQGRGTNTYYYQQNPKRSRTRPNQPSDEYQDQDQNQNYQRSPEKYQDIDINRYNREQLADNTEDTKPKTLPEETPPDNLHEKSTTEGKFLSRLSSQGHEKYQQLSTRGKIMAMNLSAHECAGHNDCKGQNACQTSKNQCAGKGSCKGQSSCKVTPEEAVKLTSMIDKRNNLK